MSKTPRSLRAKSSGTRSLGSLRLQQGPSPQAFRNDPALHINQIHTTQVSVPNNAVRDLAKEKEFLDRERKLRDQITALEKLVSQLRSEIKLKVETCNNLKLSIQTKEKEHEEKLNIVESQHSHTKECLNLSEQSLQESKLENDRMQLDYEAKIKLIIEEYEQKLRDLKETHAKEIKEKDEKMNLLKKRMAESIGKNSQERQQQLEELKKDLIKQSQEARDLQQKLKYVLMKPKQCENCAKLESKLEEKTLQVRLKENTINELQGIGRKMQVQLQQQDVILQKWEETDNKKY